MPAADRRRRPAAAGRAAHPDPAAHDVGPAARPARRRRRRGRLGGGRGGTRRPGRARTATPPSSRSSPATSTPKSWTVSPPPCSARPAARRRRRPRRAGRARSGWPGSPGAPGHQPGKRADDRRDGETGPADAETGDAAAARRRRAERAVRQIIIAAAADLLSGPAGLAAYLRTGIAGALAASVSLPLDVGAAVEIIPAHLRRAVTARDRRCRFPGCDQPATACQPHHIIPRSQAAPPA